MQKNKTIMKYLYKIYTNFIVILIGFILSTIFFKLQIIFMNDSNIAKKYINPFFVNIEKDFNNLEEFVPKNYNGNIMIILDDFRVYDLFNLYGGYISSHGNVVYENFENHFNKESDLKIIKLDKALNTHHQINLIRIVSFVGENKKIIEKHYYYDDLLEYIRKENPNANIIVNQSFFDIAYEYNNIFSLNNIKDLKISKATAYKENDNTKLLIEAYGYLFFQNNKNLLFITKCNDYVPSFTNNTKCSDKRTSHGAPLIGYEYFKK